MPIYVLSKSELKKFLKGRSKDRRYYIMANDSQRYLDENIILNDDSSELKTFAVTNQEKVDSQVVKDRENRGTITHLLFAMLYLGLFIGFLITTIAVDMAGNKHKVFIIGTILFGIISLVLFLYRWSKGYQCMKRIEKLTAYDEAVQFD